MGLLVALVFAANLVVAILLLLQSLSDPTFAWALRLRIILSLVRMRSPF